MGEPYKDEFTEEERAILEGETKVETKEATTEGTGTLESDPPAQETEKPADTATATETKKPEELSEDDKKQAESMGLRLEKDDKGRTYLIDDDGSKIPAKRWKAVYKELQVAREERDTLKEKNDLFKQLGPEEFYKIYPDDKPASYKPEARQQPVPTGFNVLDMKVTGGTYDGSTLRDVMQQDPEEGTRMLNEWKDGQQKAIREQEKVAEKEQQAREADALDFYKARVKEFGFEDAAKLKPEQHGKIMALGQEIIAWKAKHGLFNLSFEQAYKLMKHDDLIKNAFQKGTTEAVRGLQKQGPPSINTGAGGDVQPTGWEAIEKMTDKQLAKYIDGLNDADTIKFYKTAPKSFRDKHQGMPWD